MAGVLTWTVEADLDGNGSFETSLNQYLPPEAEVVISAGSDRNGQARVSEISLVLRNADGTFTDDYASSSLNGLVKPLPPIRVKLDIDGTPYTLWSGYIDSIENEWEVGASQGYRARTHLHASDLMRYIDRFPLVDVSVADRLSGAAMTAIATAMGLSGGDYSFDTGIQTLEKHYTRQAQGMAGFAQVIQSEMGAQFYVRGDGTLKFEDRHSRLGVSSPDQTWGDSTSIKPRRISKAKDDSDIYGTISTQVAVTVTGDTSTPIWRSAYDYTNRVNPNSLYLAAGAKLGPIRYETSPFLALVAQESGLDYRANSAQNGSGTDKTSEWTITVTPSSGGTSGAAIDITYQNTGAAGSYLLYHQVRGESHDFVGARPIMSYSKAPYGAKLDAGPTIAIPFGNDGGQMARDYCAQLVRTYRDDYPRLTLEFLWGETAVKTGMASLALGDQVRYVDTAVPIYGSSYTDEWFYVESYEHRIPVGRRGGDPVSKVTLIPSYLFRNLDRIAYDTFDRADTASTLGTSTSDDAWSGDGSFKILSGKARPTATTVQIPVLSLGGSGGDMCAEVDVSNMSGSAEAGVVFRYTDASNYWRCYTSWVGSKVYLEKVVAGATTTVSQPAWTPVATGRLQVKAQGNRIRAWLNRKLVIDTTDAALNTAIMFGLYAKGSTTTDFEDPYGQGM